jgi:hypothetical protein
MIAALRVILIAALLGCPAVAPASAAPVEIAPTEGADGAAPADSGHERLRADDSLLAAVEPHRDAPQQFLAAPGPAAQVAAPGRAGAAAPPRDAAPVEADGAGPGGVRAPPRR